MHMENNTIQKARDVLNKWREDATRGPWRSGDSGGFADIVSGKWRVALSVDLNDAPLIVGATDPDLLDSIDEILDIASGWANADGIESVPRWMYRLAAAIIAADERMSQ